MFENITSEEIYLKKHDGTEIRWCLEVPGVAYYGKFFNGLRAVYFYTDMAFITEDQITTIEVTADVDPLRDTEIRCFPGYNKKDFFIEKLKTKEKIRKFPIDYLMENTPSKLEVGYLIARHNEKFNLF